MGSRAKGLGTGPDLVSPAIVADYLSPHQRLVLDAMRLIGIRTLATLQVLDVRTVVTLVPHRLRITLERQDVGRDSIEEPPIV